MLENKRIKGVHISRYLASYISNTGMFRLYQFEEWLRTLVLNGERLTDEEIGEIKEFAALGKMEFEYAAKEFAKGNKSDKVIYYC